jgi:hypothetical protein
LRRAARCSRLVWPAAAPLRSTHIGGRAADPGLSRRRRQACIRRFWRQPVFLFGSGMESPRRSGGRPGMARPAARKADEAQARMRPAIGRAALQIAVLLACALPPAAAPARYGHGCRTSSSSRSGRAASISAGGDSVYRHRRDAALAGGRVPTSTRRETQLNSRRS